MIVNDDEKLLYKVSTSNKLKETTSAEKVSVNEELLTTN